MTVRYIHWQEDDMWLGYLEEFPDCWTLGVSLDDLREHLEDLHNGLTYRGAEINPSRDCQGAA